MKLELLRTYNTLAEIKGSFRISLHNRRVFTNKLGRVISAKFRGKNKNTTAFTFNVFPCPFTV